MRQRLNFLIFGVVLFFSSLTTGTFGASGGLESIEGNHDSDLRFFQMNAGKLETVHGLEALQRMSQNADLNLWLAGNQYFAMRDVVQAFLKTRPNIHSVGVITLPPGKIASAILKGGWRYQKSDFRFRPDFYATVDLKHIESLSSAGLATGYFIYLHNRLSLMVATGNPKKITGIDDLARGDLRILLPNPETEGIMSTYGKKVLLRHGLWTKLSGPRSHVRFTKVHHREIPTGIDRGEADVGMVWNTENLNARREGKKTEGVQLPPEDSLSAEVNYYLVPLKPSSHRPAAEAFLKFIQSSQGQEAYVQHGFVSAAPQELIKMREIVR